MIVVAGEALIDLAPRDHLMAPLPGGSPYNVAVGIARLGSEIAYLGGLSTDGFGQVLAERLRTEGTDLDLVAWTDVPTTLAVVHLDDQARASYGFYIEGTSAASLEDRHVTGLPDGAALHVSLGAIGLSHVPTGQTLTTLMADESGRRFVSFDPNVRPSAVGDVDAYAARLDELVGRLTLVKVSDEDIEFLHPGRDPLEIARGWADAGPALVVVTRGPDGAVGIRPGGATIEIPGERVEVVDTVGAGDAFTAGLLAWLDQHEALSDNGVRALDDDGVAEALTYARRVAAIVCTRAGADPPHAADLDDPGV